MTLSEKTIRAGPDTSMGSVRRSLRQVPPVWWGIAGLAIITLFFATTQSTFSVFTYDTVLFACMGAIALQVLQGTAGLVSVGTSGFLLLGAFGSVFMLRSGIQFPLDVIAAGLLCGVAGFITGLPALRLRSLFLALATLALFFIAVSVGQVYEQDVPSARYAGFFVPTLFGSQTLANQGRYWAWLLWAVVSLVILGASRIMTGRSGRALRMVREHEVLAPALGIPVARYKLLLFTLSSMVIGVEGGLTAHFTGTVFTDDFTLALAFQYVAMIVIGGLDSIAGAVIGAAVVVALPIWIPPVVSVFVGQSRATTIGPDIGVIIYGILVIVFVTASPGGIVGLLKDLWEFLKRYRSRAGTASRRAERVLDGAEG